MSTQFISIQATDISSNAEWTSSPDMIEVDVNTEFLQKAEKCVAFMQENDVNYMTIWWAFGYELYQFADNLHDDDLEEKSIIAGQDGKQYVEFEPDYCLGGCHAKIYKDGDLQAVLKFKHSNEELWFTVGKVSDLKLKIANKPEAVAA